MRDDARIREFIRGAARLPVVPEVTIRLLNSVESPDSSAQELAGIIEADPALSMRLLKVANSSFYGQRAQVSTVRSAVVVLGSKTIRSLALAVWTQTLRAQARDPEEAALMAPILGHGLAAGVVSGQLAERVNRSLGEDAFMAGLLHDIGRVALLFHMGGDYLSTVMGPAERDGFLLHEREQEVLGFDHRDLGSALMESWSLPPFLADVAERHHDAVIIPRDQFFVAAVALADLLTTRLKANIALGTPRPQREDLAAFFGLPAGPSRSAFLEDCLSRIAALGEALE